MPGFEARLIIEEGTWSLLCDEESLDLEMLDMAGSIRGTVHMATECPAYDTDDLCVPTGPPKPMGGYESGSHYIAHGTRCDCNWWPVFIPEEVEPYEVLRPEVSDARI